MSYRSIVEVAAKYAMAKQEGNSELAVRLWELLVAFDATPEVFSDLPQH